MSLPTTGLGGQKGQGWLIHWNYVITEKMRNVTIVPRPAEPTAAAQEGSRKKTRTDDHQLCEPRLSRRLRGLSSLICMGTVTAMSEGCPED